MTQESLMAFWLPALCMAGGVTVIGYGIYRALLGNSDWRFDEPPDEQDKR